MRRHAESSASSNSSSGTNNKTGGVGKTSGGGGRGVGAGPKNSSLAPHPVSAVAAAAGGAGDGGGSSGGSDHSGRSDRADRLGVASTKKAAPSGAPGAVSGSAGATNLSKTYLSKSHDNLASTLRRKANSAGSQSGGGGGGGGPVPSASLSSASRAAKNSSKDDLKNVGVKDSRGGGAPAAALSASATAISGAGISGFSNNARSLSRGAGSSHRKAPTPPSSVTIRNRRAVEKRAGVTTPRVAPLMPSLPVTPAVDPAPPPPVEEGERRGFERQISELVQNAETKKAEIASLKIEIRRLKEQLDSFKTKEENMFLLQNENSLLKAKLQESGISIETITDAEKEVLLRKDSSSSTGNPAEASSALLREPDEGGKEEEEEEEEGNDALEGSSEGGRGIMMVNAMVSGVTGMLSSLPATLDAKSVEGLSLDESNGWEKQSSDALSEISVANLQDRIIQMEETHYSTSEELQATLQELSDLQDSLADLTAENERLNEEKDVLVESLLAQTEKLEREREERMKVLLFHNIHGEAGAEGGGNGASRGPKSPGASGLLSDREQQLMDLIKAAHGETEELRAKQRELTSNLRAAEQENKELADVMAALKDKIHLLEARSESMYAEKRESERRLGDAKETVTSQRMSLDKMAALLETSNERGAALQKQIDSQNAASANNSPEGSSQSHEAWVQLESAKKEQENTLATLSTTRERLSESEGTVARLRDKVSSLEQMLKESGEIAKAQVSDLEYKLANATLEKSKMKKDLDSLKNHVMEVERSCEKYIEEKAEFSISIGTLEDDLEKTTTRARELEAELEMERRQRQEERDEWAQFQQDLQTVVVVANDIRKEAQEEMEKTAIENSTLKEKLSLLQSELERSSAKELKKEGSVSVSGITSPVPRSSSPSSLAGGLSPSPPSPPLASSPLSPSEIRGRVQSYLSSSGVPRGGQKRHDAKTSLSVKDLIQSIEGKVNDGNSVAAAAGKTQEGGVGEDSSDGVVSFDRSLVSPTSPSSSFPPLGASAHSTLGSARAQGAIPKAGGFVETAALKGVLKKNSGEFCHRSSPVASHIGSHHRPSIKTSTPDTDDAKCREISSRAAGAGTTVSIASSSSSSEGASTVVAPRPKPTTTASLSSGSGAAPTTASIPSISSILMNSSSFRRNSYSEKPESKDPLAALAKQYGASKRNALLKYVQNRTAHYPGIDITNFSSSWNDGMAFCALVHTYLPDKIPYHELGSLTKRRNFELAFASAEEVGIPPILNINDMVSIERPDWQQVMAYVTSIYKHFET